MIHLFSVSFWVRSLLVSSILLLFFMFFSMLPLELAFIISLFLFCVSSRLFYILLLFLFTLSLVLFSVFFPFLPLLLCLVYISFSVFVPVHLTFPLCFHDLLLCIFSFCICFVVLIFPYFIYYSWIHIVIFFSVLFIFIEWIICIITFLAYHYVLCGVFCSAKGTCCVWFNCILCSTYVIWFSWHHLLRDFYTFWCIISFSICHSLLCNIFSLRIVFHYFSDSVYCFPFYFLSSFLFTSRGDITNINL